MNKRIQELADHCWKDAFHYSPNGPETYTEFDYDKFAELIVRECVEILGTYEDYWNHYEQMEMLKKHFGVEE